MKIEDRFFNYYEEKINKITTPAYSAHPQDKHHLTIIRWAAAAAVLALLFFPVYNRISSPSVLSEKAAAFSKYHELNTRIPAGLVKISNYSTFHGGKK